MAKLCDLCFFYSKESYVLKLCGQDFVLDKMDFGKGYCKRNPKELRKYSQDWCGEWQKRET